MEKTSLSLLEGLVFIVTCVGCCVGDNILKLFLVAIAGDMVTSNVHLTIVGIVAVL